MTETGPPEAVREQAFRVNGHLPGTLDGRWPSSRRPHRRASDRRHPGRWILTALPEGLHRIASNRRVGRYDCQPVFDGLADQDPVEGIAVQVGQRGHMRHRGLVHRQRLDAVGLSLGPQESPDGLGLTINLEAARRMFDQRLPLRCRAQPALVGTIADNLPGVIGQPVYIAHEPQRVGWDELANPNELVDQAKDVGVRSSPQPTALFGAGLAGILILAAWIMLTGRELFPVKVIENTRGAFSFVLT